MNFSKTVLLLSMLFMFLGMAFFHPKWDLKTGRSTINYDVSGYYWYLPAIFIYEDVKELKWMDDIFKKYRPTRDLQQAFKHKESGNYVMKYSCGQAIMFSPFFGGAHLYAKNSDEYPADGFSTPYQFGIFWGSLLIGFAGLFMMWKVLSQFFDDRTVSIALLALVFGSNWLEYSTFTGGMTHNYLFTIYALLIWTCIHFYKKPTYLKSIFIGLLVGMAALTRPTEILAALIPLLWVNDLGGKSYRNFKIDFFKEHVSKLVLAIMVCLAVGFIQLFYWKYASGDWLVYSYEDQGFNFLKPFIAPFMWSYKTGWLVYTPMMIFALIGFYPLFKRNRNLFIVCFSFFLPFLWIAFSWKIWNYGGGIGQRTMVQSYPVLLFPLACFIDSIFSKKTWLKIPVAALALLFCVYNLWLTHQAHNEGVYRAGHMTKAYFWKTLFTFTPVENDQKLLDATEEFLGERSNIREVFSNDFENETGDFISTQNPIDGTKSVFLKGTGKLLPFISVDTKNEKFDWVRVSADFRANPNQWNWWKMSTMKLRLYEGKTIVNEQKFRINRIMKAEKVKNIFLDIRAPKKKKISQVEVIIENGQNEHNTWIDNLRIELFDKKQK